jgi:hypothetical protein
MFLITLTEAHHPGNNMFPLCLNILKFIFRGNPLCKRNLHKYLINTILNKSGYIQCGYRTEWPE